MKFYKIIVLFLCFTFFFSCKSQVEFLLDDEEKNEKGGCLIKKVEGQDICVEQKVETFHVKNLHDRFVDFLFILDVSLL